MGLKFLMNKCFAKELSYNRYNYVELGSQGACSPCMHPPGIGASEIESDAYAI